MLPAPGWALGHACAVGTRTRRSSGPLFSAAGVSRPPDPGAPLMEQENLGQLCEASHRCPHAQDMAPLPRQCFQGRNEGPRPLGGALLLGLWAPCHPCPLRALGTMRSLPSGGRALSSLPPTPSLSQWLQGQKPDSWPRPAQQRTRPLCRHCRPQTTNYRISHVAKEAAARLPSTTVPCGERRGPDHPETEMNRMYRPTSQCKENLLASGWPRAG